MTSVFADRPETECELVHTDRKKPRWRDTFRSPIFWRAFFEGLSLWLRPRIILSLWGDGNGLCGAGACVRWLGREWLYREHEEREQR